jgi:hypothetical protein
MFREDLGQIETGISFFVLQCQPSFTHLGSAVYIENGNKADAGANILNPNCALERYFDTGSAEEMQKLAVIKATRKAVE